MFFYESTHKIFKLTTSGGTRDGLTTDHDVIFSYFYNVNQNSQYNGNSSEKKIDRQIIHFKHDANELNKLV